MGRSPDPIAVFKGYRLGQEDGKDGRRTGEGGNTGKRGGMGWKETGNGGGGGGEE